ncbi:S-adenosyl methyltransferase [Lentzea xinjiangensis]|uniref:S-adenosyl methyltransferase n=1 Tax=Lentzea xinjiangensis TaxID=402600 RepID=A0A1H9UPT9_9PSEU|nr:SAM-dependent methyltransferase [Lentzea xinjiangensis]SES11023.1 S-adenosyl methyltransferase [Lentzea xinjiangensis]
MSSGVDGVPPGVDTSVPSPARVYDYWLGGGHNFASNRALGERILRIMPGVRDAARLNRSFLRRAALFMVERGVRQFLDIGSGIPTVGNLHEVVQAEAPGCRVVYVDRDAVAVAHRELLLAGNRDTAVVQADLRDLDAIFAGPAGGLLDLDRPVGLFMLLVLHFVPDGWDPAAIVAGYRDRLAPGSYLAVSHTSAEAKPAGMAEAVRAYNDSSAGNQAFPRTRDEVLAFFDGFDLVEPGLVGCPSWRPDDAGDFAANPEINEVPFAGVAVKP